MSFLKCRIILQGAGVGRGSRGYANVLEVPDDRLFENPSWKNLADWKNILGPHYEPASRMLGVTPNPRLITRDFATKTNAIAGASISESLLDMEASAYHMGGCPFGRDTK